MGIKTGSILALLAVLTLPACSFLMSQPDSKEQQMTLQAVNLLAYDGCAAYAETNPNDVPGAVQFIDDTVWPLIKEQDPSGAILALRGLDGNFRYLGILVQLTTLYARQNNLVDTSATYYELVNGLVGSCYTALQVGAV